jgi:hypothetical protein
MRNKLGLSSFGQENSSGVLKKYKKKNMGVQEDEGTFSASCGNNFDDELCCVNLRTFSISTLTQFLHDDEEAVRSHTILI